MSDERSSPEAKVQTGGKTYGKYTYKPLGGLTKVLVGLTALGALLLVMGEVIEVIDTFGDYELGLILSCLLIGSRGVILVFLPVWCIWHYRAAANLYVLHQGEMRYKPEAQVYWWFIPFANLVLAYKAMNELMWLAYEDLYAAKMFDNGPSKIMSTMPIWWAFVLTGGIASGFSFRFAVLGVIGLIAHAIAVSFYITYVRFIHKSLEIRASRS